MTRVRFAPLPDPQLCYPRDDDSDDDYDDNPDANGGRNLNAKMLFPPRLTSLSGKKSTDTASIASSSMHSLTPTESNDSTTPHSKKARFFGLFRSKDKVGSRSLFSYPLTDALNH